VIRRALYLPALIKWENVKRWKAFYECSLVRGELKGPRGTPEREETVFGENNAADGCHPCDYAATIPAFQEIVSRRRRRRNTRVYRQEVPGLVGVDVNEF